MKGNKSNIYRSETRPSHRSSNKKRGKSRSLLSHNIIKIILTAITLVISCLLVMGYISCYIDPNSSALFYIAGLGGQLLLVANIVMALYWIFRLSKIALIPLVILCIGWIMGIPGSFVQLYNNRVYEHLSMGKKQPNVIDVISYNVNNFTTNCSSTFCTQDSIFNYMSAMKPDIILMQEFKYLPCDSSRIINFVDKIGYSTINNNTLSQGRVGTLAIFSKHPIISTKRYLFGHSYLSAISSDIVVNKDTITVIGCHLQSTEYNVLNPEGVQGLIHNEAKEELLTKIGRSMHQNSIIRANQADSLANLIANNKYPVILAGDFNSPVLSYCYNTLSSGLQDSFKEAGRGYQYTYKRLARLFRIDYILYSQLQFSCIEQNSTNLPWSDHNPVNARIVINEKP